MTPDSPDKFRDENTISIEWIEPGVSYREVERTGELSKIEEIQTIEVSELYKNYRISFEVPDASALAPVSKGSVQYRLMKLPNGVRIETTRTFDRLTIRGRFFCWVDDAMGRSDDNKIMRAETAFG